MAKENRVVSYPSPLNVKKVVAMAEKKQTSKSKIVNEALTLYFSTIKSKYSY